MYTEYIRVIKDSALLLDFKVEPGEHFVKRMHPENMMGNCHYKRYLIPHPFVYFCVLCLHEMKST